MPPGASVKTDVLVTNELAALFHRFRDQRRELAPLTFDPPALAASVIAMDADYLQRPSGRAGGSAHLKITVGPYPRDPYDSVFLTRAVVGTSTGTLEYDEMFAELGRATVLEQLDAVGLEQLRAVIEIYRNRHPETCDARIKQLDDACAELSRGER